MTVTVRCMYNRCHAKTEAMLSSSEHDAYVDAIRRGKEFGEWEAYWAVMRTIDARCFRHEAP